MSRPFIRSLILAAVVWMAGAAAAWAVPPMANLLPNTTKGYGATSNVAELSANFDRCLYGQLMADPAMQPFVEDFRRQMYESWEKSHVQFGIDWEDVEKIAGGEAATAIVHPPKTAPSRVLLIDCTGHPEDAKAVLARISADNAKKKAVEKQQTVAGTSVTTFTFPRRRGEKTGAQTAYFFKDEVLGAADSLATVTGILGRWSGTSADSLATVAGFQAVMKRCAEDAGDEATHGRWWVMPLDFLTARRAMDPSQKPRGGRDYLKLLRSQGFLGIQGAGGLLTFDAGQFDMVHRIAVYAPPPFKLALRMLEFPNAERLPPTPWVPADVASYASLNWRMAHAFEMSKTMVDEIYGEDDILEDALESLKSDPDGPLVDLRKELFGNLGTRAIILFDYALPITPTSEQRVFAAECTDASAVHTAIEKMMSNAPTKKYDINGVTVWEVLENEEGEEEEIEEVVIEGPNAGGDDEEAPPDDGPLLANSFLSVAHGYLFIASHLDLLKKVLRPAAEQAPITDDVDFRLVEAKLEAEILRRSWDKVSLRRFGRSDQEVRPTFELMQQGKMPESDSLLGQFLNSALGDPKSEKPREQRIDASKLPPYDSVRRYFGPVGFFAITEENGWFGVHFNLRKDGPVAQAD
jgi:hypothetical protein